MGYSLIRAKKGTKMGYNLIRAKKKGTKIKIRVYFDMHFRNPITEETRDGKSPLKLPRLMM